MGLGFTLSGSFHFIRIYMHRSARGLTLRSLTDSIGVDGLSNTAHFIFFFQGFHDIDKEVYLSLPCVVGQGGITHIVHQPLTELEKQKLVDSANTLRSVIDGIKL